MNGNIRVESTPDHGSSFICIIPFGIDTAVKKPDPAPASASVPASAPVPASASASASAPNAPDLDRTFRPKQEAGDSLAEKDGQASGMASSSKSDGKQGFNILLAEDNLINQEVAIAFLETQNHRVTIAQNGLEALELIQREKFDLVLMDIQMPVMDGMEATRKIRELEQPKGEHLPIIAMTAFAVKGEKRKFIQAGMDDYITKPFDASDLFRKIELYCL
jgi:CheY-like chemotaxis protein